MPKSAMGERRVRRTYPKFSRRALEPADRSQRIIVLGAGLSGLSAAFQLVQAGHDLTVIEAKSEPGGRVCTLRRPFAGGQHAEAGAMFINGHHTLTVGYAAEFALPLVPIVSTGHAMAYIRGRRYGNANARNVKWPAGVRLNPDERGHGINGLWAKYILPVVHSKLRNPRARGFPSPELRKLDNVTFGEFLRAQGASAGAMEILKLGYMDLTGNGMYCTSALTVLRDLTAFVDGLPPMARQFTVGPREPSPFRHGIRVKGHGVETLAQVRAQDFTIEGGNDLLPRSLAGSPELADRVVYGAPVVRLEPAGEGIRVISRTPDGTRHWDADHVICTIPFTVLREMDLALPISDAKRRAIAELAYTYLVRQYVQTRRRPWIGKGRSGIASTDLPIMYVNDQTITQDGEHGIIESYSTGPRARAWAITPERERRSQLVSQLTKLYPGLKSQVVAHAIKDWGADPYARGAYCDFEPGEMHHQLPVIGRREGRLHFAGDHCSSLPGWMQGALESGHVVAEEVHRATTT